MTGEGSLGLPSMKMLGEQMNEEGKKWKKER